MIYDVEYDPDTGILRVRFHRSGQIKPGHYEYSRVPAWLFEKLCEEEMGARTQGRGHQKGQKPYSVGTFYSRHIRPVFPEIQVRGARRARVSATKAEPDLPDFDLADDDDPDDDDDISGPSSGMLH